MLDALNARLNLGAGAATLKIYDGTQPANANTAITTQVLLAELTFTDPAAPAAAAGVLTFSAIASDASANNSGTATWARLADSNGNAVTDCDVGTSGATINLNTVTIVAGAPVSMTSGSITFAAA
jgi:hypothetical protein